MDITSQPGVALGAVDQRGKSACAREPWRPPPETVSGHMVRASLEKQLSVALANDVILVSKIPESTTQTVFCPSCYAVLRINC
jgi:hypothetical protein